MTRSLFLVCLILFGAESPSVHAATPPAAGTELEPIVSQPVFDDSDSQPPAHMTYGLFVGRFRARFRAQVEPLLSEGDLALLDKLAERESASTLDDNSRYAANALDLCESAAAMSDVEVATALEKLALDFNQNRLARYLNAFEAMTESGRQTVLRFISDHIADSSTYHAGPSAVEFAVRSPDDFRVNFEYWCYSVRYGDLHPDVKQRIQEQAGEQNTELQSSGSNEPRIDPEQ